MSSKRPNCSALLIGNPPTAGAWLDIGTGVVAWGERATGTFGMRAIRSGHPVTDPLLATLNYAHAGTHLVLSSQQLTSTGFYLHQDESQQFPLSMEVPWGTPFEGLVELTVSVRTGLLSQTLGARIIVTPPSPFVTHVEAFRRCAAMAVSRWEGPEDGAITAELTPVLQPHPFVKARLRLLQAGSDWYGELSLYRRAWPAGWPHRPIILAVPLLSQDPGSVVEEFRSLLQDAGFDPRRDPHLPLPAEQRGFPVDGLPLPARPEELVVGELPAPHGADPTP